MLVLTRKPAEMIHIGDDIVVKVIKTARGTVKIGIEAPSDVRVIRGELLEKTVATVRPDTVVNQLADHFNVLCDQYPHVV
ncbi:MAG TPA: carbon storage regulator [Planctomycetes bacterium]|nr:carbon storage regulator [Fuerstiella sp.]HIK92969.1 carbon storage regulator [Planctomycetota bacterium]